jgi:hypothetical protein
MRDSRPRCAQHRHRQDRPRDVAGLAVDRGLEPLIGVGVRNVDDLAGLGDPAGDPVPDVEPDLDPLAAVLDRRHQLAAVVGQQVQRRALRLHQLGDLGHDQHEQRVEVLGLRQRAADLLDQRDLLLLPLQGGFQRTHGISCAWRRRSRTV